MEKNNDNLDKIRHSTSHLLAAAVVDLWPDTKPTIGPVIKDGFYYDFEFQEPLKEESLQKIEKRMRKILSTWNEVIHQELSSVDALKKYKDNNYKRELIAEHSQDNDKLSFYKMGDFEDLCKGPHVENPKKELGHFTLLSIAGAYWRGDEKNKMLTRIYGTAFETKEELDAFVNQREEAKKRDHRKLGKELDLFTFSPMVGSGLPLYTAKGTIIKKELYKSLLDISKKYGVKEVSIPHMAKIELYETSGHAEKFADELFHVQSHYKEKFVLKPVNCPHHTQIYASRPRSYRDLPIRFIETTQQHRDEKPGQIGGLTRTRSFNVDDGHTFCTVDQIKEEALNTCKIIEEFYKSLNMWGSHWVSLSVRDPKTPEKYIGDAKDWAKAEKMIQEISDELKLDGKVIVGEAAIYGPKIDFMAVDALGNERQLGTVQIDFAMPKRFKLTYIDAEGKERTPVMLHRAILGSYERFIALLLENTLGAFPLWLSPVQAKIIPVSEKTFEYASTLYQKFYNADIRVEIDNANDTLGKKIRQAELEKVPYMLIVGEKEAKEQTVSVRSRDKGDLGVKKTEVFLKTLREEIENKK